MNMEMSSLSLQLQILSLQPTTKNGFTNKKMPLTLFLPLNINLEFQSFLSVIEK